MKIDTFTDKLTAILEAENLSANEKLMSVSYWLMLFCKQRKEYLENKEEVK